MFNNKLSGIFYRILIKWKVASKLAEVSVKHKMIQIYNNKKPNSSAFLPHFTDNNQPIRQIS